MEIPKKERPLLGLLGSEERKMKYIGIIAAMDEEMMAIKELMSSIDECCYFGKVFYSGNIDDKKIVLVKAGVGKVNAASVTQLLIDKFDVECVINVGSAGAINYDLSYGDIVISTKLIQHDFDITCFDHEKGYITGIGREIEADEKLIEVFEKAINNVDSGIRVVKGVIATGDQFLNDAEVKKEIRREFNAECGEMEGAAVAQVCKLCDVPFIVIRSISDKPNSNEPIDFYKYLEMASKNCAKIVKEVMGILN